MNRPMHPQADSSYWLARVGRARTLLEQLDSQPRVDLLPRMQTELELGLMLAFVDPTDHAVVNAHLSRALDCACSLALARVFARRGSGFVIEWRSDERGWQLPARANDFAWPYWLGAFSLALSMGHANALAILATPDCIDACSLPIGQVDRFWPLLCAGMAALYQRHPLAVELFDDALNLAQTIDVISADRMERVYRPTMLAAQALAAGDKAQFSALLEAALSSKQSYYTDHVEETGEPLTLFDIVLSGLHVEAGRRGFKRLPDADYLLPPMDFDETSEVLCHYPRLSILSAIEAEWFLRNEGFARHDRSVVTTAEDGVLVATYRAYDAPGLPLAELEFELLDGETAHIYDTSHAVPALDVGELLHRAERLATDPVSNADGRPSYDLVQAIEALDLALRYLSAMPAGFRADSLHSEVGRKLYEDEPGRFRIERVQVYRNALARQAGVAEVDVAMPRAGDGLDLRQDVLALIDELKPLVLPVVGELAVDHSGESMRKLMPKPLDYERAFVGEAVDVARAFYTDWWAEQDHDLNIDDNAVVDVYLVPAGMLTTDNELSYPFPRGYRDIAPWLNPHRVWVSWRYRQPGESSGMALNGLVWLDDHWAWFPKPYRLADRIKRH